MKFQKLLWNIQGPFVVEVYVKHVFQNSVSQFFHVAKIEVGHFLLLRLMLKTPKRSRVLTSVLSTYQHTTFSILQYYI